MFVKSLLESESKMASSIKTETVDLKVSDGSSSMRAYVARPQKNLGLGLMVVQEAFGVNKHMREITERFAQAGYLAISPELFHRSAPPGFEIAYDKFEEVMPHIQAVTAPGIEADMKAAFNWLKENACEKVASIGYCLGGRVSFMANSFLPLKAAISYYGGRIAPDLLPLAKKQNGPLLFFWGGQDKHIGTSQPRAIADELLKENKTFTDVLISNADHGFSNNDKSVFNAKAEAQAWTLTLKFLEDSFA